MVNVTKRARVGVAFIVAVAIGAGALRSAGRTLDIYFVDVEGGQATLIISPEGRTLLVDTGFPGDGTFQSLPGAPGVARDAQRIRAAAQLAGVSASTRS